MIALLDELLDVRGVHPGGDVPVDRADLVAQLLIRVTGPGGKYYYGDIPVRLIEFKHCAYFIAVYLRKHKVEYYQVIILMVKLNSKLSRFTVQNIINREAFGL